MACIRQARPRTTPAGPDRDVALRRASAYAPSAAGWSVSTEIDHRRSDQAGPRNAESSNFVVFATEKSMVHATLR